MQLQPLGFKCVSNFRGVGGGFFPHVCERQEVIDRLKLNFKYFCVVFSIQQRLVNGFAPHSWQVSVRSSWLSCVGWKEIFQMLFTGAFYNCYSSRLKVMREICFILLFYQKIYIERLVQIFVSANNMNCGEDQFLGI